MPGNATASEAFLMRIVIRTDASAQIGTGHLMRCLALASGLKAKGGECLFLCKSPTEGPLVARIRESGHSLAVLPAGSGQDPDIGGPAHSHWLPGGQGEDSKACKKILAADGPVDWLIVDHYAIDRQWESVMRDVAPRIMVIDDLADRQHDCDLLLDQNLVASMESRYDGLVPRNCIRLLGPRYALLREEFSARKMVASVEHPVAGRVLVMFGGADPADLTGRALDALIAIGYPGPLDVVAGPLYTELDGLNERLRRLPQAQLHVSPANIHELMRRASVAIGSPGVSSWERCACALPTISISQADNQEPIGTALAQAGAHWYLGRVNQLPDDLLRNSILALLGNTHALGIQRKSASLICDGKGVSRVATLLCARARYTARHASLLDGQMLYEWRNHARTRMHFRNPDPLDHTEHAAWLERLVACSSRAMFLVAEGGCQLGCVRFDIDGSVAEVSIYLNPKFHGRGIGPAILLTAMDRLRIERPQIRNFRAEVLDGNVASGLLFQMCGFQIRSRWFETRGND